MSISFSSPPDGTFEMIASTMNNISESGLMHVDGGIDLENVSASLAIGVYHVDGPEFVKSKSLISVAKEVGWRYLLQSGGDIVADIHLDLKNEKLNFVSMTLSGPTLASTLQALHTAEADARLLQQDFQLRELNLAWCRFVALWLHNEKQNFVIPIEPTVGNGIKTDQIYELDSITQILLTNVLG